MKQNFFVSQDKKGTSSVPYESAYQPTVHDFHSAADGQLGGIMKVYREWRIMGDINWLKMMYPAVKKKYGLLYPYLGSERGWSC